VFAPEWVAEQVRKYGNRPDHARPTLYAFWTSDEDRPRREIIERWVDLLPPASRQRLIPRLRTPEQFEQACNELAVGDSLRRIGHAVEYEVEIDGLTPDWVVHPRGAGPAFILEVLSSRPPEERERHDEGWDVLRRRLESLPSNAFLYIQPPFYAGGDKPVAPPSGTRQKQIARYVEQWLGSGPVPGEGYEIDGIVIRFVGRNPDRAGVACGLACLPYWVDGNPLRDAVKEKAEKYRKVSESARLPLVVCVIPDFRSGRGLDELQKAVLGELRCRWTQGPQGRPLEEHYRDNDGLFSKYPSLSAVTLGEVRGHEVTHAVLHNPSATYPLGKDAFPAAGSASEAT
jgi:hypothetical protein